MKGHKLLLMLFAAFIVFFTCKNPLFNCELASAFEKDELVNLPQADFKSGNSLESTLYNRRSIRDFLDKPLSLKQISQLLWSAQGVTNKQGFRTAPSAGALYPLEIYVIAGNVDGISQGIYKYISSTHKIHKIKHGDFRGELCKAALNQRSVNEAPVTFLFSAIFKRTTEKYGKRGVQYALIEVGHAGQNLLLQSVSLGLGAVSIGAFNEDKVGQLIGFDRREAALYLIPVGYSKNR